MTTFTDLQFMLGLSYPAGVLSLSCDLTEKIASFRLVKHKAQ